MLTLTTMNYQELFSVAGLEVNHTITPRPHIVEFRNNQELFITLFKWDPDEISDDFLVDQAEKIKTIVYNRIKFDDKFFYQSEEEVLSFIDRNFKIYTPSDKLEMVLEDLYKRTSYDGEQFTFSTAEDVVNPELWRKYFFKNADEFIFYFNNLHHQGLTQWEDATEEGNFLYLSISLPGLTKLISINERKHSRFCFVAMSFSKDLDDVRDQAILPAIMETGFHPLIISKEHVESDKTINDAIIAAIKKSRFTIADFTEHKAGVYWEAGFALGRGQKVIYTCRKDHLNNAHFDTRNFQHIVWETPEELKSLLIDKIEAYILD